MEVAPRTCLEEVSLHLPGPGEIVQVPVREYRLVVPGPLFCVVVDSISWLGTESLPPRVALDFRIFESHQAMG